MVGLRELLQRRYIMVAAICLIELGCTESARDQNQLACIYNPQMNVTKISTPHK